MEQWRELSKEWNDLLQRSGSNRVFLTSEWLYSWAECFLKEGRALYILTVYNDKTLIGIAPWCIRKARYAGFPMRRIEFLGTPETGSDYLDVFAKKGKEKEVARSIYHFLFGEGASQWDCFGFLDIPSDSLFLLHFMEQMEEDGKYLEVEAGAFCPSLALPKTREEFLARLTQNRRQKYTRDLRVLEREGNVRYDSVKLDEAGPILKDFRELYQKRWADSDALFLFLERVLLHGSGEEKVQADFLNVNGKNVAGLLHLRSGKSFLMYLMAVDHSFSKTVSVGNLLVGLSIEKAIAEGFSEYNFLKGNEEYKFHWADKGDRSLHLFFYKRRWPLLIWLTVRFLKSIAKIWVR
ncbi:MAG: GNAT family N-acetyltransferase [Candidatus Manganitrophus sp.]|nr:GNAT family N-acetyltransferase [Candidatus Manganitrophus sp.]WDT72715.1 MAG: GNAT family N-acetyltransferase [Candidatus Manganitrophus sp.]WDT79819.1 MAG: GNAT family N-acetyltransferase [Candidatus Manganitrophus sp.]